MEKESRDKLEPKEEQPLTRYEMMRLLVNGEPTPVEDFAAIVARHRRFIARGGGGGRWETFVTEGGTEVGMVLGVYVGGGKVATDPAAGDDGPAEQASLPHARLDGLDLRGVELPYADLSGSSGRNQDLSGANLQGSLIIDSDWSGSIFRGANLRGADLSRTDLCGGDFREADLTGADLEQADLTGADLRGAHMVGCRTPGTRMAGVQW